jgi:uncharacterized protein YjdB
MTCITKLMKKASFIFKVSLCLSFALGTNVLIHAQNWQLIQPAYPTLDAFVAGFSVNNYGASGDGVTDVTSIFQQRIDALGALGGGTLFVPQGKYVIKGNLILRKGVTIRGEWQKPEKGHSILGTILMAYAGRGNEDAASFITMEPSSAVQDIAFWYPEQNPENIAKYPPTIVIGEPYYFGNDYCNIKNITLINSYAGIAFSRVNGGSSPVINGIFGTPLSRGIEIDNISDVGRIENIHFSPSYWENSGLPGAPASGSAVEKWIFSNGTGIVMRRNDWSYTCFVDIEGYHIGLHVGPSIASPGTSANGHNYSMTFTNCNTGIYFEATSDVGIMYARIRINNCNNGFTFGPNIKFPVQLHTCDITANQNAITTDAGSSLKLMMQKCSINKGQVLISGGTFVASDCDFNDSIHNIIFGSNSRRILTGNRFKNISLIQNNSLFDYVSDQTPVIIPALPEYTDTLPRIQGPSRKVLYNAANAPFNAKNDATTDNTSAIQNALDSASYDGGGIVFLPPGRYKVLGTLTVPAGVELKGASDVSSAPMGQGSTLEIYSGRGNESGTPFIKLSSGSGLRGVVFDYPEQYGDSVPNFPAYPYCIQVLGSDVYIVNVGLRATYNGIDLFTFKCDNHYLDYVAGQVLKTGIKVGGSSNDGKISNLQFNPIGYVYGYESKWGIWPNAPSPSNIGNIVNYIKDNLNFLVLDNCTNETLYNDFLYGSQSGLILSGASGISLGLGIDGSRKSLLIESIGPAGFDFINSQIVAIDNLPGTCYIQTKSSFTSQTTFFNSDYWGYCEYGIVEEAGNLNFQLANFQYPGSTAFANISGGNLKMQNSAIMPINLLLNSGDEPLFSAHSSVLDSSGISPSNCALWKDNLGNNTGISANKMLDRTGWAAAASNNTAQAGNAIDGDIATRWTTLTNMADGQWFTVDMKTNHLFNHVILGIYLISQLDYPVGYSAFISSDSINWTSAIASGAGTPGMTVINFPTQIARYIKIIESGTKNNWWSIHEFYVLYNAAAEPVTGITVFPTYLNLGVDSTQQIINSLTPDFATNQNVNWTSNDTLVATVDIYGNVKGVAPGSALITVSSVDGGETASAFVSVSVPVSGISILPHTLNLSIDSVFQLTHSITPVNATFQAVSWSSGNTNVAAIDANGKVTGTGAGTAIIKVSSLFANATDSCSIIVLGNINGFTVYTYNPAGWASPEKIYWWNALPSDSLANGTWPGVNMDTVVDGSSGWYKHFFHHVYSTNLIFDDGNGKQTANLSRGAEGWYMNDTWYNTNPAMVTGISLNSDSITFILAGTSQQLIATISPIFSMNKRINWNSSNVNVANVSLTGLVTAIGPGIATITASTVDGGKTATCFINANIIAGLKQFYSGDHNFKIYPNPASAYVFIGYKLQAISETNITVLNINGAMMQSENQLLNAGENRLKLNINNLDPGIYFIRFTANNFIITRKLLVK